MLNLSGFKLTFDDEFNSLSLENGSTGTWQPFYFWTPQGYQDASTMSSWLVNPGWGPTSGPDANVYSAAGGLLSIGFKPTPASIAASVNDAPFLSGVITTYRSFSQLYGYFEARAELPAAAGVNSAFWLLPADGSWPPELDVEEVLGNTTTTLVMTAHSNAAGQHTADPHWIAIPNASQGFHTYGVDWEPDTITWYFDGQQVAQEATPADMNKPMYMLLDTMSGIPGSWAGAPNPGETGQMQVDYVRAYSKNPSATSVTPQPGYTPQYGGPGTGSTSGSTSGGGTSGGSGGSTTGGTTGSGSDRLELAIAEDAWNGDAQFTVSVDGKQVGGTIWAHALHSSGDSGIVNLTGNWGAGPHAVQLSFINDAWGGAGSDRNLYLGSISFNGKAYANTSATFATNGSKSFNVGGTAPTTTLTEDRLALHLSEDPYNGDASFQVSVDGKTLDTPQFVRVLHSSGSAQDFVFTGAFAKGTHDVAVSFLNDDWGGTQQADRNLYVNSIDFGPNHYDIASELFGTGTQHFTLSI